MTDIPPIGRCCCCGLNATGVIRVNRILDGAIENYQLCNLHYRLVKQDIETCIKYSQNIQKHRVEENLAKGDWQYEGGNKIDG